MPRSYPLVRSGAFLDESSDVVCDPSVSEEVAGGAEGSSTSGETAEEDVFDWYSGTEGSSTSGFFGDAGSRRGLVDSSSTGGLFAGGVSASS